jgi:hypothetical protein
MLKSCVRVRPLYAVCLIGFTFSCNSASFKVKEGQPSYHFSFQPLANKQYHYNISNVTTAEQVTNNETKKSTTTSDIGLLYETSSDSTGNLVLQMSYDKFRMGIKKADGYEKEVDAATAATAFDPADRPFALFKDARFTITMNKQGNITAIQGYQEFVDRLKSSVQADPQSKQLADNILDQVMGTGFIQKTIEKQFKIFPDSALQVGDSWTKTSDEQVGFTMHVTDRYTLKDVKDSIAFLELNAVITKDTANLQVTGYTAKVSFSGSRQGEAQVDIKTGMLLKSTIEQTIKGEIEVIGKTVPISIRTVINTTGKL